MKDMGGKLEPGTSALFVLVRKATADRVIPELRDLGGEVLVTSLSQESEDKLRAALEQEVRRRVERGEPVIDRNVASA